MKSAERERASDIETHRERESSSPADLRSAAAASLLHINIYTIRIKPVASSESHAASV